MSGRLGTRVSCRQRSNFWFAQKFLDVRRPLCRDIEHSRLTPLEPKKQLHRTTQIPCAAIDRCGIGPSHLLSGKVCRIQSDLFHPATGGEFVLTPTDVPSNADMLASCVFANKQGDCKATGTQRRPTLPMYITDLTHFLDKSGAIGPVKGPALAMAQFHVDLVTHATSSKSENLPAPRCFKCKKAAVEASLAQDSAVVWACRLCRTEGRVSNWRGSLWDLSDRPSTLD